MSKSGMSRRRFLETSRETVAGGVAASFVVALPNTAWAKALTNFDQATADALLRMCRVLYPHDNLSDDYYAACVESLDNKASGDAGLAQVLNEGVVNLNAIIGKSFLDLNETEQVAALTNIETTPFFQAVRSHMVVALYTDRNVWSELGYEGPSFPLGGYLERGFDDIDWLPKS